MAVTSGSRLYIAGSSSAVPRPGRANSGYVLRTAGACIAVDFGSGAFSRVQQVIDVAKDLDAIVISHMHADHFFDLVPLRYGLKYEMKREQRLPVFLPAAGINVLKQVAYPLKETDDFFGEVFDLREYGPGTLLEIGDVTLTFAPTVHYIPAYALRVQAPDGVLTFSADTAPCEAVIDHACNADLFLCEAALGADGIETGAVKGHTNARAAGEMAAMARAKHLVLTHYSASVEPSQLKAAAAETFRGRITVADDGLEIALANASALGLDSVTAAPPQS